jgi:hypothetical protein
MTGAKPETGNVLRNFWTKGRLSGDALLPQSLIALRNKRTTDSVSLGSIKAIKLPRTNSNGSRHIYEANYKTKPQKARKKE